MKLIITENKINLLNVILHVCCTSNHLKNNKVKTMSTTLELEKGTLSKEEQILNHLEQFGIKAKWLSTKMNISVGHLHLVLKGKGELKRKLTKENLDLINELLKTNF